MSLGLCGSFVQKLLQNHGGGAIVLRYGAGLSACIGAGGVG